MFGLALSVIFWPIRFGLGGRTFAEKLPRRLWLAVFLGVFVGLPLAWLFLCIRFHVVSPMNEFNWVDQLNAERGQVAAQDRAWPLYAQAIKELKTEVVASQRASMSSLGAGFVFEQDFVFRNYIQTLNPESLASFRKFEADHANAIELILDGVEKRNPGIVFDELETTLDTQARTVLWPTPKFDFELQVLRQTLRKAFFGAVSRGDAEGASRYHTAQLQLARQYSRLGPLQFVAAQANRGFDIAAKDLGAVIVEFPELFTDSQLAELSEGLRETKPIAEDARVPELFIENALDQIYSTNGTFTKNGCRFLGSELNRLQTSRESVTRHARRLNPVPTSTKEMTVSFFTLPVAVLSFPDRETLKQQLTADFARYLDNGVPQERTKLFREWRKERSTSELLWPDVPRFLLTKWVWNFSTSGTTEARIRSVILLLELERIRRATGSWPTTLDAIDQSLIPRDPFLPARKIRYMLRDGRPLAWSVGSDFEDNDGARFENREVGDGHDWQLIPVQKFELGGDWPSRPQVR